MDRLMQNCDKGNVNRQGSSSVKIQADRIMEVIKEKEKQLEIFKNSKKSIYKKWDFEHTRTLAEIIMFYYTSRKVCNMYLVSVVDHILKTVKSFNRDRADIVEGIEHLCRLFNNTWVSIINLPNDEGNILRINKMFSFYEVLDKIKSEELDMES